MLTDEGTTLVKVFLNVSREEQGRRLRSDSKTPRRPGSSAARIRGPHPF